MYCHSGGAYLGQLRLNAIVSEGSALRRTRKEAMTGRQHRFLSAKRDESRLSGPSHPHYGYEDIFLTTHTGVNQHIWVDPNMEAYLNTISPSPSGSTSFARRTIAKVWILLLLENAQQNRSDI